MVQVYRKSQMVSLDKISSTSTAYGISSMKMRSGRLEIYPWINKVFLARELQLRI